MSTLKFAETHNLITFLEKPKESNGFEEIIDFLNATSIQYALTIQALVGMKKVNITETSIRNDLKLDDAKGTNCLPTATIFEELERMGFVQVYLNNQFEGMSKHKGIYGIPSHTKKVFVNKKSPEESQAVRKEKAFKNFKAQEVRKVRSASSVESLNDVSLGAPKDTSKQGRKIADLNANAEVTLINETQEINDGDLMFDIDILDDDKVFEEPMAFAATTTRLVPVTTTTSVKIPDELTLAQTLIEIKSTKTKAVTTDATTVTHVFTRPKDCCYKSITTRTQA
ncbi:hypothetical protein Tco_1033174 [Tanacetum coccineum]|uniref:Uncharacterized protein n=1 Tax=Tanacetum coccineum TaxID=301880 RepID=A0ABQ5GDX3_9ASTR